MTLRRKLVPRGKEAPSKIFHLIDFVRIPVVELLGDQALGSFLLAGLLPIKERLSHNQPRAPQDGRLKS